MSAFSDQTAQAAYKAKAAYKCPWRGCRGSVPTDLT